MIVALRGIPPISLDGRGPWKQDLAQLRYDVCLLEELLNERKRERESKRTCILQFRHHLMDVGTAAVVLVV